MQKALKRIGQAGHEAPTSPKYEAKTRLHDRQKNSAGPSFAQYLPEGLGTKLAQSLLDAVRQ